MLVPAAACALAGCHAAPPGVSPANGGLSDAQVAGVVLLANNVEESYAALAATRAVDPDVRSFAQRMATDHGALNAMLDELLGRLELSPRDDAAGLALRDSSAARRDRLAALPRASFDAAYVDVELRSHAELLRVVDDLLVPSASAPALHEYVVTLRPVITAHVAHAEQVRATLAERRR